MLRREVLMTEEVVDKIRSLRDHAYKMGRFDLAAQLDSALLVAYRDRALMSARKAVGQDTPQAERDARA